MRVVLDTNVLVSGLMFPDSLPGVIVRTWREAGYDLVVSREQLAEIGRVLAYPKIRAILGWDADTIERFLKQLYLRAEIIDIAGVEVEIPEDRDDDPILATLVAGAADCLITGDGHLLALRDRYKILSPVEFAKRL